ncbi:MAG: elongation factor P [Lewinellaceae bacterium]|nr:elongation factor P [Lewinellaceae bacterium]
MANTSDIRNGLCIELNGELYTIVEFQHVKPGKGNAFVRTKIKNLTTGKVLENTFSAGHQIFPVRVERRKFQFLYKDELGYHFMDNETYEQVAVQEELIDYPRFLKEGGEVEILFHAEKEMPLSVELPQHLIVTIAYTEPGLKGNTATNASKPATTETGAEIRVPLFIDQDEEVKIETATGNYIERAK